MYFALISGSGKIFCAETGTGKFDEINVIENGKNYGWAIKEGTVCMEGTTCKDICRCLYMALNTYITCIHYHRENESCFYQHTSAFTQHW